MTVCVRTYVWDEHFLTPDLVFRSKNFSLELHHCWKGRRSPLKQQRKPCLRFPSSWSGSSEGEAVSFRGPRMRRSVCAGVQLLKAEKHAATCRGAFLPAAPAGVSDLTEALKAPPAGLVAPWWWRCVYYSACSLFPRKETLWLVVLCPRCSFLSLMTPRCDITRGGGYKSLLDTSPEGSCSDEKFRRAECHVCIFGINRAQCVSVIHRALCLIGFKDVGHEFIINPWLTSVRRAELNVTTLNWVLLCICCIRPRYFFMIIIIIRFIAK